MGEGRGGAGEELRRLAIGAGEALTVSEVGKALGVSRNTVYKLARSGELPSYRVGRQIRFRYADVAERLAGLAAAEAPESPVGASGQARPAADVPAGVAESGPYADVLEELPAWMRGSLVLGGQDMACDVLANYLPGLGVEVLRAHVNGYVSLARMYLGTVHAAAVSLWSASEDRYNLPFIRALLPGMPVMAFRLVRRRVGFTTRARAEVRPERWADLLSPGARVANRERGASSRVLLDGRLALLEANPLAIEGYDRVVTSEFAQGLMVARGLADVAVTTELPSRRMPGLAFTPMQDEVVDLVVARSSRTAPLVRALRSLLRTEAFRSEFDATVYDTSLMGEVVYEA